MSEMRIKYNRIPEISSLTHGLISKAVRETAVHVKTEARRLIQQSPATGNIYGTHQASAPGEPPANDTGMLAQSIDNIGAGPLTQIIKVGAEYASRLENGTKRVAARPFLTPALERKRQAFKNNIANILRGIK